MTFGYVNTTMEMSVSETTKNIFGQKKPYIILSDYIEKIDNNLFGYDFIRIKITVLPLKMLDILLMFMKK